MNANSDYREIRDQFLMQNGLLPHMTQDIICGEEMQELIDRFATEEYRFAFINDLCKRFDLKGKTILEIGQSYFPKEIIIDKIAPKNWVCVDNPRWDRSKPHAHFDSMTFYDLDKIDLEDAMRGNAYFICKGNPYDIPNEFHEKFDFVVFYGNLGQLHNFPLLYDVINRCLSKRGVFYAQSGPCWSGPYGSAFWLPQADLYFTNPKFLPQYVHLLYSEEQIYKLLLNEYGERPELNQWASHIKNNETDYNRFFFEDYEEQLKKSDFTTSIIYPTDISTIDDETRWRLEKIYPDYKKFGYNFFGIIAKKENIETSDSIGYFASSLEIDSEPWSFLRSIEPYVDESRELKGGDGVTPIQYLKLCVLIHPFPTTQSLCDAIAMELDSIEAAGRKQIDKVIHSEVPAKFLDALKKGIQAERLEAAASIAGDLVRALSMGDIFSREMGMRVIPFWQTDDYAAKNILLTIARACFPSSAAQTAFLYEISKNSALTEYALAAAANIEFWRGNMVSALSLTEKAYSCASTNLSIFDLYYIIAKKAKENGIKLPVELCLDDLSEYFCPIPFERALIGYFDFDSGKSMHVACDCWDWNPVRFTADSDAWNSIQMQRVRGSILDGSFRYCSRMSCPKIRYKSLPRKIDIDDEYLADIIKNNKTVLEKGPREALLMYDYHCNIKCLSCRKEYFHLTKEQTQQLDKFAENNIIPMFKNLKRLDLTGSGEALSSPHSLNLLKKITPDKYPNLEIHIPSNGANITREKWESLGGTKELIKAFRVSIDGVGETFEKLRCPAKWEKLKQSMELLSELKCSGKLKSITVPFTLQAENYKQLSELLSLCISWHVDEMNIMRIKNRTSLDIDFFSKTIDICDSSNHLHEDYLREMERFDKEYERLKQTGTILPRINYIDV